MHRSPVSLALATLVLAAPAASAQGVDSAAMARWSRVLSSPSNWYLTNADVDVVR